MQSKTSILLRMNTLCPYTDNGYTCIGPKLVVAHRCRSVSKSPNFVFATYISGATENAGVENVIRAKMQGWKMQEWKMRE